MTPLGLPLTSSFLLEYSSEYLSSTRVLVNTGSTLTQAANDEEGWLVRIPGARRVLALYKNPSICIHVYSDRFPDWQVAKEIAKPKVAMNSNNSSTDCKILQPEMEICYRKLKLARTQVVPVYSNNLLLDQYSSTRVLAVAIDTTSCYL